MKKNLLVSVIIPSFNRFEYLLNAIDSVNSQSYKFFEIIVVNDGSTDKKYQKLKEFKNISVVNLEKNQTKLNGYGPGNIRNFGIEKSKGKYIAFLDDDDLWFEYKLELQLQEMINSGLKFSATDGLFGYGKYQENLQYELYNKQKFFKKIKKKLAKNGIRINKSFPKIWDYKFLMAHNSIITSSVMVETDLLKKIGGFRSVPFAEDYDCWLGIIKHSNLIYLDSPLIYYDSRHGNGKLY